MGVLIFIALIFVLIVLWFYWNQTYFKRHNIPYVQTNIILGGLSDALLKKCGFFENVARLYTRPEVKDAPFFGFYIFQRPALVIKDPELIKRIMIKDFNSFSNRVTASCKYFQGVLMLSDYGQPDIPHFHPFTLKNSAIKLLKPI